MLETFVRKGESVEHSLKRLKTKVEEDGLMDEVRRLAAFETPAQKAKRKAKNNARRARQGRQRRGQR